MKLTIGTGIVDSFRRMNYKPWYALAEYIDNSLQSFRSNREKLPTEKCTIHIEYNLNADELVIEDNSYGMDLATLEKALKTGLPPNDRTGLSEYGMGLKTSSFWFADRLTITTKQLDSEDEIEVSYDTAMIRDGAECSPKITQKQQNLHYTIIKLTKLHRKIQTQTPRKIKQYLSSMYRLPIRDNELEIKYNDELLSYDSNLDWMKDASGNPYYLEFEPFRVNGKEVRGWMGALASGGRPQGGFAMVRRGRLLMGQPLAWRPGEIFGQDGGTNNTLNQRLIGEIHLDEFTATHTKDGILWDAAGDVDEEVEVGQKLNDLIAHWKPIINGARQNHGSQEGNIHGAMQKLSEALQDPKFKEKFILVPTPTPALTQSFSEPAIDVMEKTAPDYTYTISDFTCKIWTSDETTQAGQYVTKMNNIEQKELNVYINTAHPFCHMLESEDHWYIYTYMCTLDALSEYKCELGNTQSTPENIVYVKDHLMREVQLIKVEIQSR